MSTAAIVRDNQFQQFLEAERAKPLQRNLFTGEPEALRIDVPDHLPEDETILDEGISVIKTEDMAQLIVSGFGLYLGKKSESETSSRSDRPEEEGTETPNCCVELGKRLTTCSHNANIGRARDHEAETAGVLEEAFGCGVFSKGLVPRHG